MKVHSAHKSRLKSDLLDLHLPLFRLLNHSMSFPLFFFFSKKKDFINCDFELFPDVFDVSSAWSTHLPMSVFPHTYLLFDSDLRFFDVLSDLIPPCFPPSSLRSFLFLYIESCILPTSSYLLSCAIVQHTY